MSATTLQLRYRHVDLGEAALHHDGERQFLSLDFPPPVRTLLLVGDRALEVESVVESETGPGGARGCYVRPAKHPTQFLVGSEALKSLSTEASSSPGDAVRPVRADEELDYGARMAVPAPVVDAEGSDSSEPIEVAAGDGDDGGDSDGAESSGSTKKRRGRKRR